MTPDLDPDLFARAKTFARRWTHLDELADALRYEAIGRGVRYGFALRWAVRALQLQIAREHARLDAELMRAEREGTAWYARAQADMGPSARTEPLDSPIRPDAYT